jgi:hypothetical protein
MLHSKLFIILHFFKSFVMQTSGITSINCLEIFSIHNISVSNSFSLYTYFDFTKWGDIVPNFHKTKKKKDRTRSKQIKP